MKLRTLLITTGSTLALAAPAATAATSKTTPARAASHTTAVAVHEVTNADTAYVAPFGSVPIVTAHYIYMPAAAPNPNLVPVYDCATTGDDCTPEQACELWGEC